VLLTQKYIDTRDRFGGFKAKQQQQQQQQQAVIDWVGRRETVLAVY
jgi:hypothetical protein